MTSTHGYSTTHSSIYDISRTATTSNGTTRIEEYASQQWLFVIQIACLSVICLVGTIGNSMICTALCRGKRKSSDYFILNLATTDLLVCAVGIPLDIYENHYGDTWPYGAVGCHVIYPSQTLLVLVSIMTLTAMSLERYRAIMTPLKRKPGKKMIFAVILVIWNLGFAIVVPYSKILSYANGICDEVWPGESHGNYYTLALFVIDYCVPLTIITYCYTRAGYSLNKKFQEFQTNTGSFKGQHSAMRKRIQNNKRVIKTFSFAVFIFVVCMLPGDVYWMWVSFGDGSSFNYDVHLRTFTNIMLYANSAINPFIFGACRRTCRGRNRLRKLYASVTETTSSKCAAVSQNHDDVGSDKETMV